jgi:hypothetical protein
VGPLHPDSRAAVPTCTTHQGCSLADIALATRLPPDQVVAIGKRTIRRTKWLSRIAADLRINDPGHWLKLAHCVAELSRS